MFTHTFRISDTNSSLYPYSERIVWLLA